MELSEWHTSNRMLTGIVEYDVLGIYKKGDPASFAVLDHKLFHGYFLYQTVARVIFCDVVHRAKD